MVKTPASLYQTILALVPLLILFFAALHRLDSFCAQGPLGTLLTVVGIVVAAGGTACFAEASIIAKLFPRSHPVAINAVALTVSALIFGFAPVIRGESFVVPHLTTTWIAFSYIVIFVTVIVFLLYLFVLSRRTASGTACSYVLIPMGLLLRARVGLFIRFIASRTVA